MHYAKHKSTPLTDLFGLHSVESIIGSHSQHCSLNSNFTSVLMLPLGSASGLHEGSCDLQMSFDTIGTPELLVQPNGFSCTKCNAGIVGDEDIYRNATRTTYVTHMPPLLVVQLQRFDSALLKLHTPVATQLVSSLKISDLSGEIASYDLVGACCHIGDSTNCGHYVTYCLSELINQWYMYDIGAKGHLVDMTRVVNSAEFTTTVYVLILKRS